MFLNSSKTFFYTTRSVSSLKPHHKFDFLQKNIDFEVEPTFNSIKPAFLNLILPCPSPTIHSHKVIVLEEQG